MRFYDLSLADLRDLTEMTVTVAASHEAGIFHALRDAPATPAELSERLKLDPRAVRITLAALREMGLLEREGHAYRPSERCLRELCDPEAETYVGRGLAHWLSGLKAWTRLGEALRRGGPVEPRRGPRSEEHVARFMSAMAAVPRERVARVVALCLDRHPTARRVLDVGGGPGRFAREFTRRGLACTLFDTAEVLAHVIPAHGLDAVSGLTTVAGDFLDDPLPEGPFDLVLLSNVLHIYGPDTNRRLMEKVAGVTAPGGMVAVVEFLRKRSRRAARFAVQMLLRSDEGDAYGEDEIVGWMEGAGFEAARVDDVDPDRQIVTALRRHADPAR